jgi:hypothetical protein
VPTRAELERAVIDAARADHRGGCAPEACGGSRLDPCGLANALEALDRAPAEESVSWDHVAAGDEVKSVKTGKFYPVVASVHIKGQQVITVQLPSGKQQKITRPSPDDPAAIVRRGPDGRAVDAWVQVFSSGGGRPA